MSRSRISAVLAGAVALGTLAGVPFAGSAAADPQFTPGATDIVGVGSDTSEFALTYLADGATVNGTAVPGYNAGRTTGRLSSFNATGSPSTVVLREGSAGVARSSINGSTAGKNALYSPSNPDVNFARSSSSLSGAEVSAGLWQVPFAVDGLKLAVSHNTATHAPTSITPQQMLGIYKGTFTNWSQLGGADAPIKPYTPQSGSGTRKFFEAQLASLANQATWAATDYGTAVKEAQEHDPTLIQDDADAVAPFSTGRAKGLTGITLEGGFFAQRALYNVVRSGDLNASWFAPIFGENGFICSTAARPLIENAGFDQLGRAADGGVCGQPTQSATSNFTTNTRVIQGTTTSITSSVSAQTVRLTANVHGTTNNAAGTGSVQFFEGTSAVGGAQSLAGGTALLNVSATPGSHTYRAVYTPDAPEFGPSSSGNTTANVAAAAVVKKASKTSLTMPSKFRRTVRPRATVKVVTGGVAAKGYVTIKKGTRQIAKKALVSGKAVFTLPRFAKGRYKITATYLGSSTTLSSKVVKFVTVTR
jgi:ABC-type phosphate transport system substrate-binding protein